MKKGTTTLSAWTYDDIAKGHPTRTTRYIDGKAYVTEITEYNDYYQPGGTKVTVPDGLGVPAGSYEWFNFYEEHTGLLLETEHPEIGGLPAESVSVNYDSGGLLDTLHAHSDPLISDTTYDHYGRNTILEYGEFGQHLKTTSVYDDHTGALTDAYTDRDTAPQRIEDSHYTYDPFGNITRITTNYGQDAARTTDTQCFKLDALTRITEAWTNTGSTCAAAPSSGVVGGQDPYWTTYSYDAVGNRKTETKHKTAALPDRRHRPYLRRARERQAQPARRHPDRHGSAHRDLHLRRGRRHADPHLQTGHDDDPRPEPRVGRRRPSEVRHQQRQDHQLHLRRRRPAPHAHGLHRDDSLPAGRQRTPRRQGRSGHRHPLLRHWHPDRGHADRRQTDLSAQ
ncbi:hypothetical protein ALMP_07240 [Streptomyces sp. A012304]|nr:hypothetical protein ALMP_07240 [Streptomyces sp. A012304]